MPAFPISIPENFCTYEEYDPTTLEPANDSTYIRLMELGWSREDFSGKSVLDIGGSSGLLSLYAHNLGAENIRYVDVQKPLVDFFKNVINAHQLPIDVQQNSFDELNENDAKDIVLLMEVLHWIIDQGGRIPEAIAKVSALANETLFLEIPWDINEPSIAARETFTHKEYNIELIIRELHKHFKIVEMLRFMTYFGEMKNSKRILLKATGKKTAVIGTENASNVIPLISRVDLSNE